MNESEDSGSRRSAKRGGVKSNDTGLKNGKSALKVENWCRGRSECNMRSETETRPEREQTGVNEAIEDSQRVRRHNV